MIRSEPVRARERMLELRRMKNDAIVIGKECEF